jgi:hypothetical protein
MRSASTTERLESIILKGTSPRSRSAVRLKALVDGSYDIISDADTTIGYTFSESGKKEKYANYALTPLPGSVSFTIVNKNGKYSEGSGTEFEGIIDKETKILLESGPILDELGGEQTESLDLNKTSGLLIGTYNYHMEYSGSYTTLTATGLGSAPPHFSDIFNFYDAQNYDTTTYSVDAYTINTFDGGSEGWNEVDGFTVTANTTKGNVYYRFFNASSGVSESENSDWTSAGSTVNGTASFSVDNNDRFLQIAVIFDGIAYSEDLRITNITVQYKSYVEFVYKSVYYLDRPKFTDPASPEMPVIRCSGRDAYKRALDTDVNIDDLSAGRDLDDLVKNVCDRVGILYNSSSINISGSFSNRTLSSGVGIIKADKIFEYIMQIINTEGYQMYLQYDETLDDNIMYVQPKPSTADASGAFNYNNYISIGDISKNSDRILQRMTVISDQQAANEEELLSDDDFTTTGSKSITWVGDREYKRIVVDNPDDITISNFEANPTSLTFDIDSITGTVNFKTYGNAWSSAPSAEGEAFDINNHITREGITYTTVNPLVLSDAECKDIAESFTEQYGQPAFEARSLVWPYLNLLPEINDLYMLWRRFIFTNDVFFVTKITHRWTGGSNPTESTTFNLDDTGLDRGDPTWDDGTTQYDKGWVWDMGISTPLNTQEEIDTISDNLAVYNVDFS